MLIDTEVVTPVVLIVELVCHVARFVELSNWTDTPGALVKVKTACVPDGPGMIEVKPTEVVS